MIRPRIRKVIADLWSNKIRSLLVVTSIVVGLFAVGLIASTYFLLSQDMRASYTAVNPVNIQIGSLGFDDGFVEHIGHMPFVEHAEGLREVSMRVQTEPGRWQSIDIRAVEDFNEKRISQLILVSGRLPQNDREIVVDRNKFPELNAQVGDAIAIKLPSGKIRQLTLVGIVHDQTIGIGAVGGGFFIAPLQGYIDTETLAWMEEPESYNRLLVTVRQGENDETALRAMADRIKQEFDQNAYVATNTILRRTVDHPNNTFVDAISIVLFILGLLVVFLSSFLITNTLSALMNQQVQQIGIMKVVGARRGQIIGIYLLLILVFSLLALAISLPLSDRAAYRLTEVLAQSINFNAQGYRTIPVVHILLAALALIVPQLAGIFPILHGVRISAQQAISGIGMDVGELRKGMIDTLLAKIRRLPRPTLISLRNAFRQKTRLALTLITLTLGGAIFISTFNVQASLNSYVESLGQYFISDVSVTFDRPYRMDKVQRAIRQTAGIQTVEGWAVSQSELIQPGRDTGEMITLVAPPADSRLIRPILLQGRWIQSGDENAIAVNERFLSELPGLQLGDTLQIRINGDETDWKVVGVFQFAGKSGGYIAYVNYHYLSQVLGTPLKATMFRITAQETDLDLVAQEALAAHLEQQLVDRGFHVSEVDAGKSMLSRTSEGINIVIGFLFLMAILTAVVGSIGLTGTMSMNVLERTREIGVMRSIGASDRIVMSLVIVEGMVIGLLSWLFGSLLAFPISLGMWRAVSLAIFDVAPAFTFTPVGFGVWLGLVALLSVLASVIPARNAARITIREALAYE